MVTVAYQLSLYPPAWRVRYEASPPSPRGDARAANAVVQDVVKHRKGDRSAPVTELAETIEELGGACPTCSRFICDCANEETS